MRITALHPDRKSLLDRQFGHGKRRPAAPGGGYEAAVMAEARGLYAANRRQISIGKTGPCRRQVGPGKTREGTTAAVGASPRQFQNMALPRSLDGLVHDRLGPQFSSALSDFGLDETAGNSKGRTRSSASVSASSKTGFRVLAVPAASSQPTAPRG